MCLGVCVRLAGPTMHRRSGVEEEGGVVPAVACQGAVWCKGVRCSMGWAHHTHTPYTDFHPSLHTSYKFVHPVVSHKMPSKTLK